MGHYNFFCLIRNRNNPKCQYTTFGQVHYLVFQHKCPKKEDCYVFFRKKLQDNGENSIFGTKIYVFSLFWPNLRKRFILCKIYIVSV